MWLDENAMWFWTNTGQVKQFVKDHEKIIDAQVDAIVESGTKLIGFTTQLTSIQMTLYYCQKIKAKNPNIKIVLGGPHAERFPNEHFGFSMETIDALVKGEGEDVVIELIERLQISTNLDDIQSVMVRDGKSFKPCKVRELIYDFDSLPFADFSDMNFSMYNHSNVLPFFFK